MGVLQKGQKADPRKMPRTKYPLPECGEGVYVNLRPLTGREIRERLADRNEENPANDFELLALCVVDDQGEPIYAGPEECKEGLLDVSGPNILGMVRTLIDISGIGKQQDREKN